MGMFDMISLASIISPCAFSRDYFPAFIRISKRNKGHNLSRYLDRKHEDGRKKFEK
jgi:hypothetical protein